VHCSYYSVSQPLLLQLALAWPLVLQVLAPLVETVASNSQIVAVAVDAVVVADGVVAAAAAADVVDFVGQHFEEVPTAAAVSDEAVEN
jgi:hypothetical protein